MGEAKPCAADTTPRTLSPESKPTNAPSTLQDTLAHVVAQARARAAESRAYIVLVCGAKGTGKSTFIRQVLRQFLQSDGGTKNSSDGDEDGNGNGDGNGKDAPQRRKCFYLETDVGQCEFTPSGLLSLHLVEAGERLLGVENWGESEDWYFRHPQHAHFLGDSSAKMHPTVYIEHVKSLEKVFRALAKTAPGAPLLVNTHGWVQGMGSLLVQGIADIVSPDIIVNIKHDDAPDAFNFADRTNVLYVPSALDHPKPKLAAELRYAHLLKYFLRNEAEADPYCWFTSTPPFCIRADKVSVVDAGGELPMSFQFLSLALNAAIVGLVSSADNGKCYGIGFVRSVALDINGKDSLIFLVTSENQEILKRVDTLVLGSERFPLDKLCSKTIVDENTPYLMHSSELLVGLNEPSNANKRNLKRRRLVHLKQ